MAANGALSNRTLLTPCWEVRTQEGLRIVVPARTWMQALGLALDQLEQSIPVRLIADPLPNGQVVVRDGARGTRWLLTARVEPLAAGVYAGSPLESFLTTSLSTTTDELLFPMGD